MVEKQDVVAPLLRWIVAALVVVLAVVAGACGQTGFVRHAEDDRAESGLGEADSASTESAEAVLVASDVATAAGIARTTLTHSEPCVADVDGDGHLDLFLSQHHRGESELFLGRSDGTFERVLEGQFPKTDRHGCAVADFDGDGRLDIYAAIGAGRGKWTKAKELWLQQPDGSFVDAGEEWGIADPGGRGRQPLAFDANGDGLVDLFTGQAPSVDFASLNLLWINRGDRFEQVEGPPTADIGNFCTATGDLDENGWLDLVVCSNEGLRSYLNDGGSFAIGNEALGLSDDGRRDVEVADLDGDGADDLVLTGVQRIEVRLNGGADQRFTESDFTYSLEDGRDVAVGDADGDGDPDIFVVQGIDAGNEHIILLNDGSGRRFDPGPPVPVVEGDGDRAETIPGYGQAGQDAFVVQNGRSDEHPGPRQLILVEVEVAGTG